MGKTVIAEESVSDYISSLYGTQTWQTGLIIGQMTGQKFYAVHLARTPDQSNSDDIEENTASSKATQSSLEKLDDIWFIEHSHQVTRMLVGGLDIVGIFIFGPPDMLSKAQPKLRQLLYSLYKATYLKFSAFFDPDELIHTRVLLQICSKTKKITCRTLDISDNRSTAQPAEYKYQSFISRWNTLDTKLSLDYKFNVPSKLEKADLNTQIMEGLQNYLQDISSAVCTINGKLFSDDEPLIPSDKQAKSNLQSGSSMIIDVYVSKPFIKESKKPKESESCGVMQVAGGFHCKACLNPKMTNKEAIQAIKHDIIRSVISRCEVLCDDVLDSQEEKTPNTSVENIWTCPRRIFVPLRKTLVRFCDYVFQDETIQDSLDRISELLDINAKEDVVQSPEAIPTNENIEEIKAKLQSQQEERNSSEEESDSSSEASGLSGRIVGAVIGLVTAVVATGVAFLWGEQANH